jgi:hypothetical protein
LHLWLLVLSHYLWCYSYDDAGYACTSHCVSIN